MKLDAGIFFYEEDGVDWAEFLHSKLAEREVSSYLENIEEVKENMYSVNLLLSTPTILDVGVQENVRSMDPHQSIIVLLGVEETDVLTHFNNNQYLKISEWKFFEMHPTEESVTSLTHCVQDLLHNTSRELKAPEYDFLPAPRPSTSAELSNSTITRPALKVASSETETGIEVFILSNRKGSNQIDIEFMDSKTQAPTSAEFIDKAAYLLRLPDSMLDSEHTFVQDSEETSVCIQGTIPNIPPLPRYKPTKQDLIRNILGYKEDPLPIAYQCLNLTFDTDGASDNELFDDKLSSCLKNLKDERLPEWSALLQKDVEDEERCPTLLHYAAEHNLLSLTNNLLGLPGSVYACFKMNSDKETPQMIAERNEFEEVLQAIKSFVKREKVLGKVPNNTDSGIVDDKKLNTIYELHEENTAKGSKKKLSSPKQKPGMWSRLIIPAIKKRSRSRSSTSQSEDMVPYRSSCSSNSSGERCESGYYDQLKHEETGDPFDGDHSYDGQYIGNTSLSSSARF